MTTLAPNDEQPPRSIGDLIEPMGSGIFRAVEPLQVAAILESQGLNDKIARERYGHDDVFSLAEAAYSHIAAMNTPRPPAGAVLRRARPLAQMLHGLLYGLPAALLPAASGLVGTQWLVPGLVLTTGIGWVLGSAAAQLAYSLVGKGFPRSAGRTLRTGLILGVVAAMCMASVLALVRNGPVALVALCVMQMAFQIASGILLFYRREGWLAAMMLPAVMAGIAYIAIGDSRVGLLAVCVGVVCIAAVVGAALLLTLAAGGDPPAAEPPLRTLVRPDVRALLPSFLYALLTAVFLLQAEARYVLDRTDIAVAGAGLVLGMGVLEYRAHVFEDEARAAIRKVCYPAEFTRHSRRLLAKGVLICLATLSVLAALPLSFLYFTGTLSYESVAMAAAHVAVGGAYFLAFLLANQGKVVLLCLAQGVALAVHPVGRLLLPAGSPALADVLLFLGAASLFFVILLALMSRSLRDVKQYR
ncbi:hypothetical protein [Nonomuraea jiangxiensis]|uniref:Membrane protein involved in the export of O-antigen and teichoic acid n=1 Tax=Nonomuraea jiangxiensis TaxID=633440 RepID=A0A1G8MDN6_9ACTN|nr:hypothetical protein [Nonomuraea jiangxiensis]SDI66031.1 hypothetical protein SAMN05421869_106382 [Nonomuraea jiangxiensis]